MLHRMGGPALCVTILSLFACGGKGNKNPVNDGGTNTDGGTSLFATPEPLTLAEKWNLQLVPSSLPALDAKLEHSVWRYTSPQNILGGHATETIAFDARDCDVRRVLRRYDRTTKTVVTDTKEPRRSAYRVERALLAWDGGIFTAAVDGKTLYIGAAVPVGRLAWYLVRSGRHGATIQRTDEWSFAFDEDPRADAAGKVTIKHRRHAAAPGTVRSFEVRAAFVARPTEAGIALSFKQAGLDGGGIHVLPRIHLLPGGVATVETWTYQRVVEPKAP